MSLDEFFTIDKIQNIKILLYKNNVFRLRQDLTCFNPSFACLPIPVEKEQYLSIENDILLFNSLISELSRDTDFLYKTLDNLYQYDPFVKGLIDISKASNKDRVLLCCFGVYYLVIVCVEMYIYIVCIVITTRVTSF